MKNYYDQCDAKMVIYIYDELTVTRGIFKKRKML